MDNNIDLFNDIPDAEFSTWILGRPERRFQWFGGYVFEVMERGRNEPTFAFEYVSPNPFFHVKSQECKKLALLFENQKHSDADI